ncbi:hypothetical protein N7478_011116 [Penicillium angulare]|uniref:uncharacterized protein n=1 Tax=Penicillium angulare TaxID=116970 RepID=UPI002542012D|nr:uncharacterized protein N7478_011116 [Penicillium angulare]KAJ5263511.1 hypothetical protein N7478_011116 [Penicillium angulare]
MMVLALIDVATVTWGSVNADLGFSFALLNDSYAAGCGALCIGGVFLIPFALKFGRRPIYVLSTAVQCGISVWSAKMETVADLMLVNVLSCIVGSLAEVLVQMTIADVFFVHERGLMNTIYYWFMTVGVTLAPLAGGFITLSQGWRWVWWWMAILFGAGLLAFVFLYEETMFCEPIDGVPIAEQLKPGKIVDKEDIDPEVAREVQVVQEQTQITEVDRDIPLKSYRETLALWSNSTLSVGQLMKHTYQPFLVMSSIPAVFFMALQYGIMTACTTVPVTTLSSVMTLPPYNFGPAQIGLMGIPPFIGTSLATLVCGPLSDYIAMYLAKRNGGIFEPEMRLWLSLIFAPLVPAGLFMFGIGLNNGSHWLLPAFGLGVSGFGVVPPCSAALTYLTDAYTDIIADSVVGVTFIRNLISTVFVFALQPWCDRVGLTWFYVTFGLISLVTLLGNVIFIYFGKKFRAMVAGRYRRFSAQQLVPRD